MAINNYEINLSESEVKTVKINAHCLNVMCACADGPVRLTDFYCADDDAVSS